MTKPNLQRAIGREYEMLQRKFKKQLDDIDKLIKTKSREEVASFIYSFYTKRFNEYLRLCSEHRVCEGEFQKGILEVRIVAYRNFLDEL